LDEIDRISERFGNVTRLGFMERDELNGLYAACKVFCLPSTHEGTGLVALEAASYGAAVVITRNGGTPDYFLDLAEYVDPDSVENIRQAVERAWNAPPTDALRRHVVDNLSWDQSAASLARAYERRLEGR